MIDFEDWCYHAVAEIRFKPDRNQVFQELKNHLEDSYDHFLSLGHPPEKARQLAIDAMGDPDEIAPQLGQIHKPWLGWLYRLTKWSAIFSFCWALFLITAHFGSYIHALISTANYDSLRTAGEGGYYRQPDVTDRSDGYYFKITEAAVKDQGDTLYIELQTSYWPWMRESAIAHYFWAVDSLGNRYASRAEAHYEDVPKVSLGGSFSTAGFSCQDFEISHFDSRAEWVELRYDRDGRNIVLRIELSGGEEA